MFQVRYTVFICLFVLLSGSIFFISLEMEKNTEFKSGLYSDRKKNKSSNDFTGVVYYVVDNLNPQVQLNAEALKVDNETKETSFDQPDGYVLTEDKIPVYYKADSGIYDQLKKVLTFNGQVNIDYQQSHLDSDWAKYTMTEERFDAKGEVKTRTKNMKNGDKIFVDSNEATSWTKKEVSEYRGNVVGKIKRKRRYEPDIDFWTDHFRSNMIQGVGRLTGNVKMKKQELKAESLRGEIFFENYNKKLKYYVLYDDVRLEEKIRLKDGTLSKRRALGEKLEVYNLDKLAVLTGAPKVYQDSDVIKGNVITLRENTEIIEVDDANSTLYME